MNDSTIVYSSNFIELPDSVLQKPPVLANFPEQYNLYRVQVLKDTTVYTKLTNANSKNTFPKKINANNLVFLSDLSGISNLVKHNIGNQVSTQISSFDTSIEVFDVNSRMNKLAYAVRNGKESELYVDTYTGTDQFTPSTPRLQLAQAKELNERLAARRILEAKTQQAARAKQEKLAGP